MKRYLLEVKTNKNIGDEHWLRGLLTEWREEFDEALRPERFALGEPVRRRFADEGIEGAVRLSVDTGVSLMLARVSKPKFLVDIHWRREKGLDSRPFPWSCTVWLDFSAGDERALNLFRFLIRRFEPVFGFVSTEEDDRDKHFINFDDIGGQKEMYVGQDVDETLPGVYWVTYFGPGAVEKIGGERFADLKAEKVESIDGGYLVQAYCSPSKAGSSLAREAETRIMNRLGKLHFFNKASVDIEALKTSPEEAELVEEKIKELKAKKKQAK
jgi:hypothetical protein